MAVQKIPREPTEPTDVARSKTLPPEVPVPAPGGAGFTDSFGLAITFAEAVAVATDDAAFALALAQSDTVDPQSEAVMLGFPAGVFVDNPDTPTDAQAFTMRVWLSGSAGAGVTNPANADGQNNATNAVISTAVAGAASETMTSLCGVSVPAGVAVTSVIFRAWFVSTIPLGTSAVAIFAHSSSALYADVTIINDATARNHSTGDFTFDLVAAGMDTLAELQSTQFLFRTTDAVAGVTPAVLNVDAGCLEIAAAFT